MIRPLPWQAMGDGYILDNAWAEGRRRLSLLEQVYDPLTIRSLESVGVKPGWRCLEVGAGGGSISRWLCAQVGPSGRVVAVDLDTRFVEEIAAEQGNLDVHRRDVVADGIPGGDYDLIHARMVLMHIPARRQVLEALAASLRPGGWLVIEDGDTFGVTALADGAYADVWRSAMAAFDAAGMDHTWARQLPGIFDQLGLEEVGAGCDVGLHRGGSAFPEVLIVSLRQLRPLLLAAGATVAQLDDIETVMADPSTWFPGWGMVCVRGRAPAG